jgi:hypothetical protein
VCRWLPSCARACDSLQNRLCVALIWRVCRCAWLKMAQLQSNRGRQQTEVLCPCIFGVSRSSQMLADLFVWFSALHFLVR